MKHFLINLFFVFMIIRPLGEYLVLIARNYDEKYICMVLQNPGLMLIHGLCSAVGIVGLMLYNDIPRRK